MRRWSSITFSARTERAVATHTWAAVFFNFRPYLALAVQPDADRRRNARRSSIDHKETYVHGN
jgi:hypothetical protein